LKKPTVSITMGDAAEVGREIVTKAFVFNRGIG